MPLAHRFDAAIIPSAGGGDKRDVFVVGLGKVT
jgi:hypothetical protein